MQEKLVLVIFLKLDLVNSVEKLIEEHFKGLG